MFQLTEMHALAELAQAHIDQPFWPLQSPSADPRAGGAKAGTNEPLFDVVRRLCGRTKLFRVRALAVGGAREGAVEVALADEEAVGEVDRRHHSAVGLVAIVVEDAWLWMQAAAEFPIHGQSLRRPRKGCGVARSVAEGIVLALAWCARPRPLFSRAGGDSAFAD